MKNRHKRAAALALSLILAFLMTGCGRIFDTVTPSDGFSYVTLPKPEGENSIAPAGDEKNTEISRPGIFYAAPDGSILSGTRVIYTTAQEDVSRRLAEEVLKTPTTGAIPVAPKDTRVIYTESAADHAAVCIQPSEALSENEKLLLISALTKTIFRNTSVTGVSLLLCDRAVTLGALPAGVVTKSTDLTAIMNEPAAAQDGAYTRTAALYLPSKDRLHVQPLSENISVSSNDPARSLLTALSRNLSDASANRLNLNPETAFEKASDYTSASDGSRVLNLYLTESAFSSLASAQHSFDQAIASITLTLTTFLPQTDGVSIHFPSGMVTEAGTGTFGHISAPDGILRRSHFSHLIGTPVTVYYANEAGTLSPETRVCPVSDAMSVRTRIGYLLEEPHSPENRKALPAGIRQTDFIGIRVSDGVAHINLSGELYRSCQAFTEEEEKLFIYSIVNTVSELDSVTGVRFYVEDETVSVLTQYIHLETVLIKNPGLVSEG